MIEYDPNYVDQLRRRIADLEGEVVELRALVGEYEEVTREEPLPHWLKGATDER